MYTLYNTVYLYSAVAIAFGVAEKKASLAYSLRDRGSREKLDEREERRKRKTLARALQSK